MLTNNLTDQDKSDSRNHGLALDITNMLDNITNDQGTITTKETNVTADVARYEKEFARAIRDNKTALSETVCGDGIISAEEQEHWGVFNRPIKAMENMYSSK